MGILDKGLCYNYDAKFTLGHHCSKPRFLYLLTDEENDLLIDKAHVMVALEEGQQLAPFKVMSDETLCISFHALTGQVVPSTLKLARTINGRPVVTLIDSGSTNSFIQKLAKHLTLTTVQESVYRFLYSSMSSCSRFTLCYRYMALIYFLVFNDWPVWDLSSLTIISC